MKNEPETAMEMTATSYAKRQRDARFAALCDSAVHRAMDEYGRIDPERAEQSAFDIARAAVVTALTQAFDDDAELKYTRGMLDHVMEALGKSIELRPTPALFIPSEAFSPSAPDPR